MTAREAAGVGATCVVAFVGVMLAKAAGLPLPWMLGPLFTTAVLGLAGLPVARLPRISRTVFIPIIGLAISSGVTPEVVASLVHWWPSLLAVIPFAITVQLVNYGLFRSLGGYDRTTAYFAASPGGLVEAVLLGERKGGNVGMIALQHSGRVSLSMLVVPLILVTILGTTGDAASEAGSPLASAPLRAADVLMLGAGAALGAAIATRLNLPAAIMIGPFLVGALLYGSGHIEAGIPDWLINMAQFVMGTALGTRFKASDRGAILSGFRMAVLALTVSVGCAALVSGLLHSIGVALVPLLFLSFAPGGLAEMSLVAISLGADPVFVAAHHMVRIVATVLITPIIFDRLIDRS